MTDKTVWLVESGEAYEKADEEKIELSKKEAVRTRTKWEDENKYTEDTDRWIEVTEMELTPKVDE